MKIVQVFNRHQVPGGSNAVAEKTAALLKQNGYDVEIFIRNRGDVGGLAGTWAAAAGSFYPFRTIGAFVKLCESYRPDVVHAHEIYPLISPWIFPVAKKRGVATILSCHDYRLSCPALFHMRNQSFCSECTKKGVLSCVKYNCCGSLAKSAIYSLRNIWAAKMRLYSHVDRMVVPSASAKHILVQYGGIPEHQVTVIPNPVDVPNTPPKWEKGHYVGYLGRISAEKGVGVLLQAMEGLNIPLAIAGPSLGMNPPSKSNPNVQWRGMLAGTQLDEFIRGARFLVVPSQCHETFGLAVCDALTHGRPAIVSDLGALSETGGPGCLVFHAADSADLRACILRLWNDSDQCRKMVEDGFMHIGQFASKNYVAALDALYTDVINRRPFWASEIPRD